jgi:ribulose-phosphate 3-epimerase
VRLRTLYNYSYLIEIDGGINGDTATLAKAAGVDIAVVGSYVFNAKDRDAVIGSLR